MWLGLCLMLTISGASGKTFRGASNDPPPLGCKAKIDPKIDPKTGIKHGEILTKRSLS
jgi:hypothetical protein